MPNLSLANMTSPEFQAALETARVAIIPVGAHEQHGPHLGFSTDIAGADAFSRLLVQAVDPLAVLVPPIPFGVSPHHIHFPGTISLRPDTFIGVLMDVADSLRVHGIRRLFVVNGHGGNQSALGVASARLRTELGVRMHYAAWPYLGLEAVAEHVHGRKVGHACILETSLMMHLVPEIVRPAKLAEGDLRPPAYAAAAHKEIQGFKYFEEVTGNGAFDGATEARAEIGEQMTAAALRQAVYFVREFAMAEIDQDEPEAPNVLWDVD